MNYLTKEECIKLLDIKCNISFNTKTKKWKAQKHSVQAFLAKENTFLKESIYFYTSHIEKTKKQTERIFIFLNNIKEIPKCFCGNYLTFKTLEEGYGFGCCESHCKQQYHINVKNFIENYTPDFTNLIDTFEIKKLYYKNKNNKNLSLVIERYFYKNPIFLNSLLFYTKDYIQITKSSIISKIELQERLYFIIHNLIKIPKCNKLECKNNCNFIDFKKGYHFYCSIQCSTSAIDTREKIKNTNIERIGVSHPFKLKKFKEINSKRSQTPEAKEKRKQTNLQKYGVEFLFNSKQITDKGKQTYFNKTGYYHNSQNPDCLAGKTKAYKYGYYKNIYYYGSYEKEFLILMDSINVLYYVSRGKTIKYSFYDQEKYYYYDYLITYPDNTKDIIEIKAPHHYFYKDLTSGKLFQKWNSVERFIDAHKDYKNYHFILNNSIITKQEIIDKYLIPYFHKNYPYL